MRITSDGAFYCWSNACLILPCEGICWILTFLKEGYLQDKFRQDKTSGVSES